MRSASWLVTASVAFVLCTTAVEGQPRYIDGVFVQTPSGPIELIAYAESMATGILRLSYGSMDDVPPWGAGCRVLVSLPAWRAAGAIISTDAIFEDSLAERRDVRWFVRTLNIYATEMEFKELAKADFMSRTLRNVKASDSRPAYIFVVISDNVTGVRGNVGMRRFYPMRVDPSATAHPCTP